MKKLIAFIFVCCSILSLAAERIAWEYLGTVPAQKGYTENVGTAGLVAGALDDYILLGGGANFPNKPLTEGGGKVTHKDWYLYQRGTTWNLLKQGQWDYPLGYGANVVVGDALYYLGGSPEAGKGAAILKCTVKDGNVVTKEVGSLAKAFANGVAAYRDGKIYYGVGKFASAEGKLKNSNEFYAYDIKTGKNKRLADFPGAARQQTVGQILNGKFYIFSGGSNVSYVDGYAYDFASNTWTKAADVIVDGEKILLLGANSVILSPNEMLVIGGFNYDLWNEANEKLSTLKGDALAAYKEKYFGQEPFRYHWNRKILVYNAKKNTWKSIGEVPFDAPCGEALLKINDDIFMINGEIKPGVRTPRIFRGRIYED